MINTCIFLDVNYDYDWGGGGGPKIFNMKYITVNVSN